MYVTAKEVFKFRVGSPSLMCFHCMNTSLICQSAAVHKSRAPGRRGDKVADCSA
jgi:hypothetical protein